MSTEFLSLVLKHLIAHSCGALCITTVHNFYCYASGAAGSSPSSSSMAVNPLNAELNPICHLLALLGGATVVVVSRLRVNRRCFLSVGVLWCRPVSRPVPMVI
jgi:hypothetical protein